MGSLANSTGGFLSGFANGFSNERDRRAMQARQQQSDADRAADRELDWANLEQRREESRLRYSQADSDPYYDPNAEVSNGPAGGPRPRSTVAAMRSSDPVNMNLSPTQRAFLNAISGGESAGKYNIRYTPAGGELFDLSQGHPRIYENSKDGKSSAAGRYQFVWSTWKDIAGADTPFTPENQDKYAWALAAQNYQRNTGRDLDADLQAGGITPEIQQALSSTWTSWKNAAGRQKSASIYADSVARYSQPAQPVQSQFYSPSSRSLTFGAGTPQP